MPRLSARSKSRLYSSLEKYARAGMGIEKGCESLLDQPRISGTERQIYEGIRDGLAVGKGIGESLGASSEAISALEEEVVTASEAGGMLETGFGHLSEYFLRMDQTRRRIVKGLIYPIVLVHIAVPITTFAVTVFSSFSLDGGAPGNPYLKAFTNMGIALLVVYILIALLFVFAVFLSKASRNSAGIDSFINKIPILGRARKSVAMERFARVFEIFLMSGLKMSDALRGSSKASGSGLLKAAGDAGAKQIENGDNLATALYAFPKAFPNDFARGVATAEESGQLDRELAEWGSFYAAEARDSMDRLAEWTPKLFYWGILFFVAFLIIRAALAYNDLLWRLINFTP